MFDNFEIKNPKRTTFSVFEMENENRKHRVLYTHVKEGHWI